jgi:hypothetical protein
MLHLGSEGGIDGALDAAKADVLILPSIICSDIPDLAGHPTITVVRPSQETHAVIL